MFEVDKCEWFEIEQLCKQCGQYFIADFAYNDLCFNCRHPKTNSENEDSEDSD